MRKDLFSSPPAAKQTSRRADTTNQAGGLAYSMTDRAALAQYAVTGAFQDTCSTQASTDLQRVITLCKKVDNQFVAKTAIYARKHGVMKDVPAFLVAYLATTNDKQIFQKAFDKVIDNFGMLRNFVQIMRSGVLGRKSLGSSAKRACQRWFKNHTADRIFWQAFGNDPSPADVIKLVHPRPSGREQEALFGYMLGKKFNWDDLPFQVRHFEHFKSGNPDALTDTPDVQWNRLVTLNLTRTQWGQVFDKMTWNQLRKNLNTALRHGVYDIPGQTDRIATRLREPRAVQRSRCFPFEIWTGLEYLDVKVPAKIRNAMQDALELSLQNAPVLAGGTDIIVDVSGSMGYGVIGKGGVRGKTKCIQVASLFAAAMMKADQNNVRIFPVDTRVHPAYLNTRDSLATLTKTLQGYGGGGTSLAAGMSHLNAIKSTARNVIIVSDNESWQDRQWQTSGGYARYGGGSSQTGLKGQWDQYLQRNRGAKLICWDITPNATTQAPSSGNTLNVGGFSSRVFDVIEAFIKHPSPDAWVRTISQVQF